MTKHALALAFTALVVACSTTQPAKPETPTVVTPIVVAEAGASPPDAGSKIDIASWQKSWPKTWKDPRVVDALAQQCDFVPGTPPPEDGEHDQPADMFRCTLAYSQSCNPDVCFMDQNRCDRSCTSGCQDCGTKCAGVCNDCKAKCHDASCVHQCAASCADCKQSCTAEFDRCATGTCGKVHAVCQKKLEAAMKKASCPQKCKTWEKCAEKCDEGGRDPMPCHEKCDRAAAPTFQKCSDACDERNAQKGRDSGDDGQCLMNCYLAEPCAPFLCMGGLGRE